MKKRYFILGGGAAIGSAWLAQYLTGRSEQESAIAKTQFEINKTEEEWRKILTRQQFQVLRLEGTEAPGSSPLLKEHRTGTFACSGCDLPLFSSKTKYESGTGWPSFYEPIEGAIAMRQDGLRKEVHCRRCGGHLGHVFEDGPNPTGLRYCMNGVSLKFIAGS
jgi:peptide-methionine (R)-S-oxide reductase